MKSSVETGECLSDSEGVVFVVLICSIACLIAWFFFFFNVLWLWKAVRWWILVLCLDLLCDY